MYEELVKRLRSFTKIIPSEHTFAEAADAIEELEAVNQRQLLEIAVLGKERKAGVWLMDKMTRTCSVCGQMKVTRHKDNYCPNCGSYNGGESNV